MGGIKKLRINDNKNGLVKVYGKLCRHCGKSMYKEMIDRGYVWKVEGHTAKYYCDDCKHELFEGVKRRWEK